MFLFSQYQLKNRVMQQCGYHHRDYAISLSDFGDPVSLPRSGGWLLQRSIPGSSYQDAMGCYPLFACDNWNDLYQDLRELKDRWISAWLVTDPFADLDVRQLRAFFKDVCFLYKEHRVVDLSASRDIVVSKHHQRYARKALKHVDILIPESPRTCLEIWTELYGNLIRKHKIKGISRFSKRSFAQQLKVPGCVVFQAIYGERIVAMQIWYQYNDRAYYHLGASSDEGYRQHAAFGIFWKAIGYFQQQGLQWLNLGAGSGTRSKADNGLARFKNGWSNAVRPAYFCGIVMDPKRYNLLGRLQEKVSNQYFPAYREKEVT
jgi:hypothetical protein